MTRVETYAAKAGGSGKSAVEASTVSAILAIVSTALTGCCPPAVSPESITALTC